MMAASKGIRASGAKTFEPGFNIISVPMRPANTPVISMSRSFSFKKRAAITIVRSGNVASNACASLKLRNLRPNTKIPTSARANNERVTCKPKIGV